jgi:hypothetical protein
MVYLYFVEFYKFLIENTLFVCAISSYKYRLETPDKIRVLVCGEILVRPGKAERAYAIVPVHVPCSTLFVIVTRHAAFFRRRRGNISIGVAREPLCFIGHYF